MTLPNVPRKEQEILSYCKTLLEYFSQHPVEGMESNKLLLLNQHINHYHQKQQAMKEAYRVYQERIDEKDSTLAELIRTLRHLRKLASKVTPPQRTAEISQKISPKNRLHQPPAAPRELRGARTGLGSVFLEWRRPKRGTGGKISFFEIHYRTDPQSAWMILDTTEGNRESTTIHGLPTGIELEFKIVSKNQYGRSSDSSNSVTLIL